MSDIREVWPSTWTNISIRPHVWGEYPPFDPDNPDCNQPNALHVEVQVDAMRMGWTRQPMSISGHGVGETLGQALVDVGLQMAFPNWEERIQHLISEGVKQYSDALQKGSHAKSTTP